MGCFTTNNSFSVVKTHPQMCELGHRWPFEALFWIRAMSGGGTPKQYLGCSSPCNWAGHGGHGGTLMGHGQRRRGRKGITLESRSGLRHRQNGVLVYAPSRSFIELHRLTPLGSASFWRGGITSLKDLSHEVVRSAKQKTITVIAHQFSLSMR
ncbi:hypothetical protein BC827DRAFT_708454 [Russula dissimulans]|nr:hypothetical protein BC827DRAFT_708454 [Russula dissimulans]